MPSQWAINYGRQHDLVFSEASCSERTVNVGKWLHHTRGSTKQFQNYQNSGTGAASLYEMSMRTLLLHANELSRETLIDVPWAFARRIWKRVVDSQLKNVKVWQAFAMAYQAENVCSLLSYSDTPAIPREILLDALSYLQSSPFQMITLLTLFDVELDSAGWLQVGRLSNLGALVVADTVGTKSSLDDRAMRSWALNADEASVFFCLRLLIISQPAAFPDSALIHLGRLPKLVVLGVKTPVRCKDEHFVRSAGWHHCFNSTERARNDTRLSGQVAAVWSQETDPLLRSNVSKYFNIVRNALLRTESMDLEEKRALGSPLLNLRCGSNRTMPLWMPNHLAWFERTTNGSLSTSKRPKDSCLETESKKAKLRPAVVQDLGSVWSSFLGE